jgi:hypothetical protein
MDGTVPWGTAPLWGFRGFSDSVRLCRFSGGLWLVDAPCLRR